MQPDHPERHDLWGPIVIARDSALTENICVGVSDCARPERSGRTFSFVDERKKKEEKEAGETRPGRQRGGCNGAHIIMDQRLRKVKRHDVKCTKE